MILFNNLKIFFKSRQRRKLRFIMRGYRRTKLEKKFGVIRDVRNGLVDIKIGHHKFWDRDFFGICMGFAELPARQFLIERYGVAINKALFESLGSNEAICLGMPQEWRIYLRSKGWRVNGTLSAVAWGITVLARYLCAVLQAAHLCIKLWRATPITDQPIQDVHVVFESLTESNLPIAANESHDICSFYAKWPGRLKGLTAIYHTLPSVPERNASDIPVRYRPPVWELNGGCAPALYLAGWVVLHSARALLQMLTGSWQSAILLYEATRARAVQQSCSSVFAQGYFFHSSSLIYRPMWTYEVEQQGSAVTLYFYSTFAQPKLVHGYEAQKFEWGPATWPHYLVWDKYQENMLKRDLGDVISVTHAQGITFSDSDDLLPPIFNDSVAVFSSQPHRPSAHFGISTLADCFAEHPDYYLRFLEDVTKIVAECGGKSVLKDKRDIGYRCDKRYRRLLQEVIANKLVSMIDPSISAIRVIEACKASISLPFSSTAIYASARGRPSIFYDPAGWMQHDDLAAHGIPILRGRAELREWLKQVL